MVENQEERLLNKLLFEHVLPKIVYEMHCNRETALQISSLFELLREGFTYWTSEVFVNVYPEFQDLGAQLAHKVLEPRGHLYRRFWDQLLKKGVLRNLGKGVLSFLHICFQDWLASRYILVKFLEHIDQDDPSLCYRRH